MKCKALKEFISPRFGNVEAGRVLDLEAGVWQQYVAAGLVAAIEPEKPKEDFIQAAPSSSVSQAAQVSQQTIAPESKSGRRGRPKKGL